MTAFRSRIPVLLIVVGLVMPAMPVAGDSCPRESCSFDLQLAVQSHGDAGADTESCCETDEGGNEDCCPHDCRCICCDTVVVPLVRSAPSAVKIAPRSIPVAMHRPVFAPQDAVNRLLRPPQA